MRLDLVDRTPVTIYNRVGNRFQRTILNDCIWKHDTKVSFKSQGVLPLDSVKLYIQDYSGYVPYKQYEGNGWTITGGSERKKTYIVKGICHFDLSIGSESNFKERIRAFEKEVDYKTANVIKENFFGSGRIRHLMVIC